MNPLNAIRAEYGDVWAITPNMLKAFARLDLSASPVEAKVPRMPSIKGSVGVLPLSGVITQHGGGILEMLFGGTSTDIYGQAFDTLMADSGVGAVLMPIASPGGTMFGVEELATKIREARGTKPIIGVVDSLAGSAAYYIGSQVDKLYVTPGGLLGSIGVYMIHIDESEAMEAEGLKPTVISAGKYKVEDSEFGPLTDEAREHIQERVDRDYDMFVDAVAKGRGVTSRAVKSHFGQGRLVGAQDAVKAGMADGVASFEEVLDGMLSKQKGRLKTSVSLPDIPTVVSSQGAALEVPVGAESPPEDEEEEKTPRKDAAKDRIREASVA